MNCIVQMSKEKETEFAANDMSPSLRSRHHFQKNPIKGTSKSFDISSDTSNIDVKEDSHKNSSDELAAAAPKQLPFEFKALEACLESACRCLESELCTIDILICSLVTSISLIMSFIALP